VVVNEGFDGAGKAQPAPRRSKLCAGGLKGSSGIGMEGHEVRVVAVAVVNLGLRLQVSESNSVLAK